MQTSAQTNSGVAAGNSREWPTGLTRIPFWLYQDPEIYSLEQQRVFQGPVWNYLCLEAEVRSPGDWITTHIGEMPVVVTRDQDGVIHAFENRCAHRGALICLEPKGHATRGGRLVCVYHNWTYDLQGNLKSVAFQRGVKGKGGMPETFNMEVHGPRKLRVTSICGLVFGSLSSAAPPIKEYLGPDIVKRIERVLHKPVVITGRVTQALPNNWKLYFENVKDSYHASLLHVFLTTFQLNRLTQPGGLIVSEGGAHHVSYSYMNRDKAPDAEYGKEKLRSDTGYRLQDVQLLDVVDEFGDGIMTQILSVFPNLVVQQVQNTIAVRQILPKGQRQTHLKWTFLGFEDDDAEMKRRRLLQTNMIGPAGYVSLEDGAIGGFVQRAIGTASGESGIVEMGGNNIASSDTRATEASVRGFWQAYRTLMAI